MRVVVTINMVGLNAYRRDSFEHPSAGLAIVLALVAWTAAAIWLYRDRARRTPALLVADLAIAVAAIAVTPWVKGPDFNATIPGFWVMGALLAWAIHWHWKGGLAAAIALSATDLLPRSEVDQGNYGNVFLVLIGGPIVGYLCESLQRMARERDAAERARAAAEERTRLARAVHDGVLQVLAMTQRRGAAAGGEWADLGRLAGEQERSLRSLIRQQDTVSTASAGRVDLAGALEAMATAHPLRVEVATPGGAVLVDPHVAAETVAAVRACLDNVLAHVGPDASALGPGPGGARRGHRLRARRRAGHRGRAPGAGRGRGSAGRRVVHPRPRRGARRHGHGGERFVGHRVGADRAASVTA